MIGIEVLNEMLTTSRVSPVYLLLKARGSFDLYFRRMSNGEPTFLPRAEPGWACDLQSTSLAATAHRIPDN
jgi:hypothetical protein